LAELATFSATEQRTVGTSWGNHWLDRMVEQKLKLVKVYSH